MQGVWVPSLVWKIPYARSNSKAHVPQLLKPACSGAQTTQHGGGGGGDHNDKPIYCT